MAKFLGGGLAEYAGQRAGVARGAWHSLKGVGPALDFVDRLLDPDDAEEHGAENSAWGQLFNAGKSAVNYIHQGIANPSAVGQDVQNAAHQLIVDNVPSATPVAPTFTGEMARRFGIGANQGELGWDAGTLLAGAPSLKVIEGLGAVGDATTAAEFANLGFTDAQAARLTKPYTGVGHHSPVSQSLAKTLGLPDWLRDSEFNVVKPDDINQGDFYKLHFQTDPQYFGSGFSPKIGGGWSGKKLGFQKYGLLGRFWYGTPPALAGVSAAAGVTGLSDYQPTQDQTQ
jgi:hypothetical protein